MYEFMELHAPQATFLKQRPKSKNLQYQFQQNDDAKGNNNFGIKSNQLLVSNKDGSDKGKYVESHNLIGISPELEDETRTMIHQPHSGQ
ncbi:hypothetical protein HYC85_025342 [Camellia sinensis]|uniref:Uncharacterized protein n=1 Tax=Camellia sinensis TaxID=4442 RepID=A0A7J7GER2_CAMSI|nr:hypothetical protein HYC85_025342 [Camellia sinensis]